VSPSRDDLISRISEEKARLATLNEQQEQSRRRLKALERQLAETLTTPTASPVCSSPKDRVAPVTPAAKVELFRSLFRGRPDVFPTRFVSKKTGKSGYAPACANKFVRGVCELPKVKCGECPNQAFHAADDQALANHLRGRHVMGVYPLLDDDTCWFLAADFDKTSWKADVSAFAETCRSLGVPVSIERSRSGNGAHAWFFFTAPVAAAAARRMGCYLITQTMTRRHELSMKSYDRLFPNQDTLPRGGFGNLIALPLQREARRKGNTVFLDDNLEPHADQWTYLASVPRIEPAKLVRIAQDAARTGQVIGVRLVEPTDEDDATPWRRPPSGRTRAASVPGPLPEKVHAVLAQRLFVEKGQLPSALLNRINRLAAFQNPEFYKKQMMRLSTAGTPRVISCAEERPQHISLPRNCLNEAENLLQQHGVALVIEDKRHGGDLFDAQFQGELTPLQEEAATALLQHDVGVFVAPPGIGKTVLGTYVAAARGRSTLVLVHRRPLLDQWVAQLSMFLGIDERKIGRIGGGRRKTTGALDVAMIQSLARQGGTVDDIVATYGHVIVDECHHVPAVSFERVLSEVKARYILGLTATPHRRDGRHPILEMQLGPVRFSVDPKSQAARRPFEHRLIVRETGQRHVGTMRDAGIQTIYNELAADEGRNRLIVDDVIQAVQDGRSPILLTERRDHLECLTDRLRGFVRHLVVLRGGMSAKERKEAVSQLTGIPDQEERLVLATGRYIGEGFDDARLDTLFLAMPVSWKGTLAQYTGRLHRLHPGKTEVRIYDYVDREIPMLMRMFEKRLRAYRAIGYERTDAPLDDASSLNEPTVEYDEEACRQFEQLNDVP